jgi:hypothetical protein
MHVGARSARKAFKEIGDQLALQVTDKARANPCVHDECRPATEVDGGDGEGFVHGHYEVAGAQNAPLVAESAIESLAESNADIFHGVVLIDIEVAVTLEFEIERSMAREKLQHVIEEADPGRDLVLPFAFDGQLDADTGLGGVAVDNRGA